MTAPDDAINSKLASDDAQHPPLSPGERLWSGYRVIRHLNRSLDSDVYEVWSSGRECSCIAKSVLPWKATQERSPKRLRDEGELLRRLSHPNIVRGLSVKEEPTGMVMERLRGHSLQAITRSRGDLGWRALTQVGLDLAAALHYLHRVGYLHLDVKPDNVIMTPSGAVLIDFNLALPPGRGRRGVGSRYYMAPEQVEATELTPATDVFALGMTLYAAACCDLPARGDEKHPHLHRPMRSISERRNLPELLRRTIDGCLHLDPAKRLELPTVRRDLGRMMARLDKLEQQLG